MSVAAVDRDVMRQGLRLALAAGAIALVLFFPVRSFLTADLPAWIRLLWPLALGGALVAPISSLLVFLVVSPLLFIVPSLYRWPSLSLPELWLFALLIPAWVRAARRSSPLLPSSSWLFGALATASVVMVLSSFRFANDGLAPLFESLRTFASQELFTSISQRPPFSPLLAWVVVIEGLALLWLVMFTCSRDPKGLVPRVATAMALGAALVATFGSWQWWTERNLLLFWVVNDPNITRVNATFTDVNALGSYLASIVFVAAAVGRLSGSPVWRWGWRLATALIAVGIICTGSRAAWFAAMAVLGVYAVGLKQFKLLEAPDWATRNFGRLVAVAGLALILALASLTIYATSNDVRPTQRRSYLDSLAFTFNLRAPADDRLKGRLELWRAAGRMIAARPLAGIGIGRYYKDVSAYTDSESLIAPQENTHNYFLQVGAELGLAGLVSFAALLAVVVSSGLRVARGPALKGAELDDSGERSWLLSEEIRRLALAATAGVLAFALTQLTGHSLLIREGQLTFWPLAAMLLLLARPPEGSIEGDRAVRHGLWTKRLALAALIVIVASVPVRMSLDASRVDMSRVTFGIFDPEAAYDGTPFRWIAPRAVLHVPGSAAVLTLPVRSTSPFPQTVRVLMDGRLADEVQLTDHNWRMLRYELPQGGAESRYHRFDIEVSPPWTPDADGRELGVMLGEYAWK